MDFLAQIAIALAAALHEAFPRVLLAGQPHPVTIRHEADPDAAYEDETFDEPLVSVVAMGEEGTSEHGIGEERFQLLLVVQHKILNRALRADQVQVLSRLAGEMARWCRPIEPTEARQIASDEVAATCVGFSRKPAVNLEELRKNHFYCEVLTTWKTA